MDIDRVIKIEYYEKIGTRRENLECTNPFDLTLSQNFRENIAFKQLNSIQTVFFSSTPKIIHQTACVFNYHGTIL